MNFVATVTIMLATIAAYAGQRVNINNIDRCEQHHRILTISLDNLEKIVTEAERRLEPYKKRIERVAYTEPILTANAPAIAYDPQRWQAQMQRIIQNDLYNMHRAYSSHIGKSLADNKKFTEIRRKLDTQQKKVADEVNKMLNACQSRSLQETDTLSLKAGKLLSAATALDEQLKNCINNIGSSLSSASLSDLAWAQWYANIDQ